MTPDRSENPPVRPLHTGMALAAVAAAWGWLMYPAHYYWGAESYYNFGWFVPFIAGYFLYRKIHAARFQPADPPGRGRWITFWAAVAVVVALVTFARLFSEADIFWRVPIWGHGLLLLGFSYLVLWLFGGRSALRTFAFPLFFLLMALPWPSLIEIRIIQSLTQMVTDLTVIAINLIGYPAAAMGNTIQVMDTHVGVDEACSGIRSLQALVVIALFFGEYLAFGLWRRIALLAGALFLSMAFNGARAIILTLVTVNGTEEKFAFWHDFLGNFNAIICGLLLFGLAELLEWLFGRAQPARPAIPWRLWQPRQATVALAAVAGGFLLSEAAVQGYYKWRELNHGTLSLLAIQWPDDGSLVHEQTEIPERTQEILQYEFGAQYNLRWQSGLTATMVHYGYSGEDRSASAASYGHSPDICMTAAGARLVEEKSPVVVGLMGDPWPASHYEFAFDKHLLRQTVQVFYVVWEQRPAGMSSRMLEENWLSWERRMETLKNGRRDTARQVILVYFHGDHPDDFLRAKFAELLDRIVVDGERAGARP